MQAESTKHTAQYRAEIEALKTSVACVHEQAAKLPEGSGAKAMMLGFEKAATDMLKSRGVRRRTTRKGG